MKAIAFRWWIECLALLTFCAVMKPLARADDEAERKNVAEKVYLRALRSTVRIMVREKDGIRIGSGVLIDHRQRFVLTSSTLFENVEEARVFFPMYDKDSNLIRETDHYFAALKRGEGYRGKVLHRDAKRQLALRQLEDMKPLPKGTIPVELAAASPKVGQKLYGVGNPGVCDMAWVFQPYPEVRKFLKRTLPRS
jgi:S1-C subfamily serine protease